MNLTLLSKKDTEQLEYTTVPIENLTTYAPPYDTYYFRLNRWYTQKGLTTKQPEKDFLDALTHLVGHAPVYRKQYEYNTAVWGFTWQEEAFVLFRSRRGISIQVQPNFPAEKRQAFLGEWMELLDVRDIQTPY